MRVRTGTRATHVATNRAERGSVRFGTGSTRMKGPVACCVPRTGVQGRIKEELSELGLLNGSRPIEWEDLRRLTYLTACMKEVRPFGRSHRRL